MSYFVLHWILLLTKFSFLPLFVRILVSQFNYVLVAAEIPSLDTTETSGTTTQPLTKSMKKRLKKKQKKAASGTSSETQSPATDSPKPSPIPSPRTLHVVRKHYMIFANTLKHPETRLQENSKESEASAPVLNEIPVPVPVPVPVPSSIPVSKGANEQSETLPEAPKAKPVACQADVPPINWKVFNVCANIEILVMH